MAAGDTSNSIGNRALMLIGDNMPPVTGYAPTFDSSTAGQALSQLYTSAVQTVAREFSWDFARNTAALVLSGNIAPFPWAFEYIYPPLAIQIWQVTPPSVTDTNNPLPIEWSVGNNKVGLNQVKVIWTNQATAQAVMNNLPPEATWDSLFVEAVVRYLAGELALAVAGKPDVSVTLGEAAQMTTAIGTTRDS